jgi:hypothetical protein
MSLSKIDWDKIPTITYTIGYEEYSAVGVAKSMLADETPIICIVQFKGKAPRYSKTTVGSVRASVARAWLKLENELCK